jgi:hypothetical protein
LRFPAIDNVDADAVPSGSDNWCGRLFDVVVTNYYRKTEAIVPSLLREFVQEPP